MISREELLKSPEYHFENAQNELYAQVMEYMEKEGINQNQLAERLGVTKGYVSQLLKGQFNHTLKKLIDLSLAMGMVPHIEYRTIADVLLDDSRTYYLHEAAVRSMTIPEFSTAGFDGKEFTQVTFSNKNSALPVTAQTSEVKGAFTAGEPQFLKTKTG